MGTLFINNRLKLILSYYKKILLLHSKRARILKRLRMPPIVINKMA